MAQHEVLQRILVTTRKLISNLPPTPLSNHPCHALSTIPPLRLSKSLSRFQWELRRESLLSKVHEVALKRASELAAAYQKAFEHACDRLSTHAEYRGGPSIAQLVENLRSTFENCYEKNGLRQLLNSYLKVSAAHNNGSRFLVCPPTAYKERHTFNHEYTPLLEKYFELNAYPSAPDRLLLAEKSMMSSRQIEVWFQNHRNRAKKDGKKLARLTGNSLAANVCREALQDLISSFSIPDDDKPESDSQESDDEFFNGENHPQVPLITTTNDVFSTTAPPHAFPTVYGLSAVHNAFPHQNENFKFHPPDWRRRPAATKVQYSPVNMDEFTTMFETKLNICEGSRKKANHQSHRCIDPRRSWFTATVTIPFPAPHPALVSSSVVSSPTRPSASPPPPTLVPPSSNPRSPPPTPTALATPTVIDSRKVAPLPRRAPKHAVSSTGSLPSSRSSSFGSIVSSNGPTTPPSSPILRYQKPILTPEIFGPFFGPGSMDTVTSTTLPSWDTSMNTFISKPCQIGHSYNLTHFPTSLQA